MYDFPEKLKVRREVFRRRIVKLGFGSPQLSVFVSPLSLEEPIAKLVSGEGLEKFVWVLRADGILGMSDVDVARASWPLKELNNLYRRLFEIYPKINISKNKKLTRQGWIRFFLAVNSSDPYLPKELLPDKWAGVLCKKIFREFSLINLVSSLF
ncbi:MAG: hypothetical protein US60_C0039G0014 [Microgenomates group bacterium GW2011_GWC1_37_8]|nr:MAG: hypothetical protein US60_C0039G0014 [Microgenomates group bacterium GW2011_GWC1_37_8]